MFAILLAEGFEEIEAFTPADILRRCDMKVCLAGVSGEMVTGAHGITVQADALLSSLREEELDGVILPGGMPGTNHLAQSETVQELVKKLNDNHKLICAICAAPSVLGGMGLLEGKHATCFPGYEDSLKGAVISDFPVVIDDNIITSKGAGTSHLFAAEIVKKAKGAEAVAGLLQAMQY